jgi:hypothetical protein
MATAAAVLLTGGRSVQTSQPPTGSPCGATINPIRARTSSLQPGEQWDIGATPPFRASTEISVDERDVPTWNDLLKINTTASAYAIDIYRLGYYSGLGAQGRDGSLGRCQPADLPAGLRASGPTAATGLSASWVWDRPASTS